MQNREYYCRYNTRKQRALLLLIWIIAVLVVALLLMWYVGSLILSMRQWSNNVITLEEVDESERILKGTLAIDNINVTNQHRPRSYDLQHPTLDNLPIPAIIHQTWKDNTIPTRWKRPYDACQRKHATGYTFYLWTDKDARDFIAQNYAFFLPVFDSYEHPVERADAFRYFALYHYGGIYIDLDVGCRRRLDALRVYENTVVLPKTEPFGFSNDFIMATPRHPFMRKLIDSLEMWHVESTFSAYGSVMASTGPLFVDIQYMLWDDKEQISVLPDVLYGGGDPDTFFGHWEGSSWHEDDAKNVLWINDHPFVFTFRLFLLLGTLVGAIKLVCCQYRKSQNYRSLVEDNHLA